MKKLLLLLSVVMMSMNLSAQLAPARFDGTMTKQSNFLTKKNPKKSIQKADENVFNVQFCGDIYSWYTLIQKNKVDYKCYLYISPEMATMIAGNKITEISFSCASNFSTTRDGYVFVAEDINADPVTSTTCKVVDSYSAKVPYQTIALSEPYTIKENTGFYFGYVVKQCRYSQISGSDYPVGVDGLAPNGYSGFVELKNSTNGEVLSVIDMDKDMGTSATNLFLAAKTVGAAAGFENVFQLGSMSVGDFTLSVIEKNKKEPLYLPIKNMGGNTLTSLEYSIDVNGVQDENRVLDINVAGGAEEYLQIPAPEYVTGRNSITLHVTKVNGMNYPLNSNASCIALDNEGFDRKMVVEEGTGTWCGWCPRGIVGLEKMTKKYPNTFIGIAIHSGDNMQTASYNPLLNAFFSGFPNCVINRDPVFVLDPNIEYLELCNDLWSEQRAPGKVDLTVVPDDNGLKVNTKTTFAYNETDANYKLAFVILEDGLTDVQSNYYAAGKGGQLEWWDEQGSSVNWVYEHTARDIFDCFGLTNSLPTTITAGTPMGFEAILSTKNVTEKGNTSVIALLLDGKTGTILNATKVEAKDYADLAGIAAVGNDNNSEPQYFDIKGMRVEKPTAGSLIICRKGNKISKVIVK